VDHVTYRREGCLLEARIDAWLSAAISATSDTHRGAQLLGQELEDHRPTPRPRAAGATNTLWMYASYFDIRRVRPSSGASIGPRAAHAIPAGRIPSVASTA